MVDTWTQENMCDASGQLLRPWSHSLSTDKGGFSQQTKLRLRADLQSRLCHSARLHTSTHLFRSFVPLLEGGLRQLV